MERTTRVIGTFNSARPPILVGYASVDVERKAHLDGDRVVVTFDGKFLTYAWTAAEG